MEIKLIVNGRAVTAYEGERLSDVLIRAGIPHARPCGGRGVCGKCMVLVNGRETAACRYLVTTEAIVEVAADEKILSESGMVADNDACGSDLVLDIGTTTLVLALIDRAAGRVLRLLTENNPQRQFGADVISRIAYCRQWGVAPLSRPLAERVSEMIAAIGGTGVETLHVSGNTTMLHIFAGEDPTPMGVTPYTPRFLEERRICAAQLGIAGVRQVHLLPSISAFVGADLVAGVKDVGFPEEKYTLLLDLGTNAELLLFSSEEILATSAAAGPCFEGANISCGMSATRGAIYAYDGTALETVDNAPPRGLCGTGLVDVVATLLRAGVIDETGYMEQECFPLAEGVSLTQEDVRQYQLAKAAIYAAILALMHEAQVTFSDIGHLYISGGFSTRMNVENAAFTGLIPSELCGACTSIGNSSLRGAIKAVTEDSPLTAITEKARYIDLSRDKLFSELFIENMTFRID